MAGIAEGVRGFPQPPGGLLKAGIFDPVPLAFNDGRYIGQDNLPGDIVEGAVCLLSCFSLFSAMSGYSYGERDACLKEAERTAFQDCAPGWTGPYGTVSKADAFEDGIACAYGKEIEPYTAACACRVAAGAAGGYRPARVRADDRTCSNIATMVRRTVGFFGNNGPLRRIGFSFGAGYGERISSGFGLFLTDSFIWDMAVTQDPLPPDRTMRLLVRLAMCRESGDPDLERISNIGLVNPRLGCAYVTSLSRVPPEALQAACDAVGLRRPLPSAV